MPDTDPLEARLTHARDVLVSKAAKGELTDDLLEVRDDVLFLYQHLHNQMHRIETESKARDKDLDDKKVDRNPNAVKAGWIVFTALVGSLIGFFAYLIQQGGSTP
jgi:hypothetical protein